MDTDSSPNPGADPLPPETARRAAGVFYGVLAGAGLLWCRLRTGAWLPSSLAGGDPLAGVGLGVATAGVEIAVTGILLERAPCFRRLAEEFRGLLGPLDTRTAAVLALASGPAEEIFFRGAMQPVFGLAATSLLFGLVHCGPGRRYLVWTAFAVVMGFLLGGILELTGSLLGPILVHTAVNGVNLLRIGRIEVS